MKKILYTLFTIYASVALVACQNENILNNNNKTGQIDLSALNVTCNYDAEILRSSNIDNFIITITEKSTNTMVSQWKYSEMPQVYTLIAGTYTLKAESCELKDAAWEAPYYADEKEFKINVDKVTAVGDLTCVLKNVKVTVEYSDEFMAAMGDDCNVNVALGKGQLNFTKNETRAAYFAVEGENNILHAYFSGTIDGYLDNIYNEFDDVKAGEWRILRYTLKENNVENKESGSFAVNMSVDVSCNTIEQDIQVDIEEEIIADPNPEPNPGDDNNDNNEPGDNPGVDPKPENGPVISATTFNIKEPQYITGDLIIQVVVNSELPLAGLVVEIDSEALSPEELEGVGLAAHLDLVNPGEMRAGLEGLGFPVAENVLGKNEISFDITPFAGLLASMGSGTHRFILTATDDAGNATTETLTLIAE